MCRETESLARLRHAAVTLLSSIIFYTDAIIRVVIFTQIESDKSITVFISFETHHLDWKVSFFPFSYIFEIERSFPRFAGSKNHRPVHAKRRVNKNSEDCSFSVALFLSFCLCREYLRNRLVVALIVGEGGPVPAVLKALTVRKY